MNPSKKADAPRYTIRTLESVAELPREQWDALVEDESPFLSHAFLSLLDATGCTGESAGWYPLILAAYRSEDTAHEELVGAAPMYIKTNSEGEFIFDWSWADAAYRAGIDYYPKGLVAIPFSPVSARKLLTRGTLPEHDREAIRKGLILATLQLAQHHDLSSLHYNFLQPDEIASFEEFPTALRYTMQYHWYNRKSSDEDDPNFHLHYDDFDDFLSRFRSKRRANIRRERRKLREQGVRTRVLQGADITDEIMERMFGFYLHTVHKFFYGRQYLTHDLFMALPEALGDHLHLVIAEDEATGHIFGGALNLYKDDRLYGRYWGSEESFDFAHFEVCMYTPIEWCIEQGVAVFEPGAGGEHKYERGFEPTTMLSMHYMRDPRLAHGVEMFLEQERHARQEHIAQLQRDNPFKS